MWANGLHRIRWRRVAVELVHRTAACHFARALVYIQQSIVVRGVESVGKRTPSDPMETGCRGTSPSDCRMSFRESLSIYTPYIQQTIVVRGVENVGKRTPSDQMETGCRGTSPSDCRMSFRESLSIYTPYIQQTIVVRGGGGGRWKMLANGLHRIRWRRIAVELVHRTAVCQFVSCGGGGKCRQTDSIGSDGDGLP